jgi:hypothetical protein
VDRAIVAQADIDALTALANDVAGTDAVKAMIGGSRPGDVVFIETATATATPGAVIPTLGSYADVVIMPVEVKITATAVLADTLQAFGQAVLANAKPGSTLVPGSISAVQAAPATIAKDTGAITAQLRLTGQFAQAVSEDDVRDAVKGESVGDAESTLRERYGIQNPEVEITPGWAPWVPRFGFRIDVKLLPGIQGDNPAPLAATNDERSISSATPTPSPGP